VCVWVGVCVCVCVGVCVCVCVFVCVCVCVSVCDLAVVLDIDEVDLNSYIKHIREGCSVLYGVATISRLLKNIGLFCKRAL